MDVTLNHFKKFLVDEIMRHSLATAKEAMDTVNEFAKTEQYEDAYKKWKSIHYIPPKPNPVKKIDKVVAGIMGSDTPFNLF